MNADLDFHERLEELRDGLARDLEAVRGLAPLAAARRELDRLVLDLDQQLHRARRAAVVVLVGPTGAGKSTLLNALVGREIAKEGELRPTTSRPTVHAPEDADLSELLAGLEGPTPDVVRYDPTAAGPFAGQVLIDAPDTNSAAREHRATVRALAERADVLLVLLKAESVVEESTLAFLDEFRGRRELLVVLGRADELSDKSRAEVLAQLAELARERLGADALAPLAISARDARAGRGGAAFDELVARIEQLSDASRLLGVRRHNALGAAARVAALVEERCGEARAALDGLGTALESGLATLAARTADEVTARVELRAPELAERVAAEAGRQWNGPVGWTLRIGMGSTLGIGAAALVARRNPLLAAGAALAGTAIGRARDVVVDRRLEDTAHLLPEPGEFEAWWFEALSDVRLAAGRLEHADERASRSGRIARAAVRTRGVDETLELDAPIDGAGLELRFDDAFQAAERAGRRAALGRPAPSPLRVPDAPALLTAFARPVADAWQRLLARDLPEAAARASRWPAKFAFDALPYALLAWMVWGAARGFVEAKYAGLDYFLNAFFLLFALLLVLRLAVGRWHAAIGRRLARGAASRATSAVITTATAAAAPLAEAARARASALDRLTELPDRWRASLSRR